MTKKRTYPNCGNCKTSVNGKNVCCSNQFDPDTLSYGFATCTKCCFHPKQKDPGSGYYITGSR